MEFTIDRKAFLTALDQAAKAQSPLQEILKMILCEVDPVHQEVVLTATNLELTIQSHASAGLFIERPGKCLIHPVIRSFLAKMDDDLVSVSDNGRILEVRGLCAGCAVCSVPAEDFPNIQIEYPNPTIRISGLRRLADHTLFSASSNQNGQPEVQGIRLCFTPDVSEAFSSDGKKLSAARLHDCSDGDLDVFIRKKNLKILRELVGNRESVYAGIVKKKSGSYLLVMNDEFTAYTALLHILPPDFKRMFSAVSFQYGIRAASGRLREAAVNAAGLSRMAENRCISLQILPDGLEISSTGKAGRYKGIVAGTVMDWSTQDFSGKTFFYDPFSLLDFLNLNRQGDLILSFDTNGILSITTEDQSQKFLLVPMSGKSARTAKASKRSKAA